MTFYTGPLDVFLEETKDTYEPIEYRAFEHHFVRATGIFMFKYGRTWYTEGPYSFSQEPKHWASQWNDTTAIQMIYAKKAIDKKGPPMAIVPTPENKKSIRP